MRASRALVPGMLALLAAGAASARWASHARDPEVALLIDRGDARWIIANEPFSLARRPDSQITTSFRARFRLARDLEGADVVLSAFRAARLFIDESEVSLPGSSPGAWKEPLRVPVGPLAGGEHRIEVRVRNRNAPPALLLDSGALGLVTGPGWEARRDGSTDWAPSLLASAERRPALALALETAPEALWRLLPFHLLVFALVAFASRATRPLDPASLRLAFIWAWALLGANNVLRIPEGIGFDAADHLDYIRWVAERRSIPLATDGWQMFQSPLYYIISAPLLLALEGLLGPITISGQLLRVIPLACGAAQVEVVYRTLRIVFPLRPDLQRLGLVAGAFLPMNLYMSQYLGNEPLAGLLSAVAVLCALRVEGGALLRSLTPRLLALGVALGLALLAKATAALLVVPLAAWAALAAARGTGSRARAALGAALPLCVAGALAAPYYARNWICLGKPFVGGWDASRGISWWQDPGYRTPEALASFGEALVRPIHAAASSFWDGVYSTLFTDGYLSSMISAEGLPPWNFGLLLSGALLALVPAAAVLAGAARSLGAFWTRPDAPAGSAWPRAGLLATLAIGIYLAAMADLFIALPVYSTVKASYMSGLTPCFAILAAAGLEPASRPGPARALVHGALAAWAASAYLAYFVV